MNVTLRLVALSALAAASSFVSPARAGLSDCGNIHVEAESHCVAEVEGGCTAKCTPVSFHAACAAKLEASCTSKCDLPSVDCNVDCQAGCEGSCEAKPAEFECSGSCTADCSGTCTGHCEAADDKAACKAQCEATCSADCEGSCKGTPASASCSGKCEASCSGQCTADTHMECQVKCQSEGFAKCELDMKGGCEVQCEQPEGAIYCDGQYVDHGGHAQECYDALVDVVASIDVSATGSAYAECSGNECHAEAEGEVSCAVVPGGTGGTGFAGVGGTLAGLFGLSLLRRRRAR